MLSLRIYEHDEDQLDAGSKEKSITFIARVTEKRKFEPKRQHVICCDASVISSFTLS